MPKGPDGQKRPADVVGAAVKVAKIATGEEDEDERPTEIGVAGGKARAKKMDKKRRSEIARKAAKARWKYSEQEDAG